DDITADRSYIKEFVLTHSRELGRQYGVEYAEAFHYIEPGASGADRDPRIDAYVKEHAVPSKWFQRIPRRCTLAARRIAVRQSQWLSLCHSRWSTALWRWTGTSTEEFMSP